MLTSIFRKRYPAAFSDIMLREAKPQVAHWDRKSNVSRQAIAILHVVYNVQSYSWDIGTYSIRVKLLYAHAQLSSGD